MVDNRKTIGFVNNSHYPFLLITYFLILITILKIPQTKLGFKNSVLDYIFIWYYPKIVLIFYPKLWTLYVNLKLTEYQAIAFCY